MKNPIRFLRISIGVQPLMAAGGICTAAVLVFVWADGFPGRDAAKRADAAHPCVEKTPSVRSNNHARTSDPAHALTQAFTLADRNERQSRVRDLLAGWAARDADAALSWVSALGDSAARRSARSTVCLAVAQRDPRRAVTLALAHGADEGNEGGLLECLTMQWCEKEAGTVLDWAREQPQGEWRDRLLGRVSFVLSKSDPVAAAQLVSGLEPGAVQDEAAMAVLHQWALKDSSAALQWAEGFAETSLRDRALVEISNLRNLATALPAE